MNFPKNRSEEEARANPKPGDVWQEGKRKLVVCKDLSVGTTSDKGVTNIRKRAEGTNRVFNSNIITLLDHITYLGNCLEEEEASWVDDLKIGDKLIEKSSCRAYTVENVSDSIFVRSGGLTPTFRSYGKDYVKKYFDRVSKVEQCIEKMDFNSMYGAYYPVGMYDHQRSTVEHLTTSNIPKLWGEALEEFSKEKQMKFELTQKTYLNGQDVKNISDDDIFDMIAEGEEEVERLKGIKTKSEKLSARIEELESQIAALAELVDNRD